MSEEYGGNRVGILLLDVFFKKLRPAEEEWRDQREAKYTQEADGQGIPVEQSSR